MEWDEWIEVDNHYLRFHADKTRRLAERANKCVKVDATDPRVYDGTLELLEELTGYLTERYPSMFQRTPIGLNNLLTGEVFDTRAAHLTVNGATVRSGDLFGSGTISGPEKGTRGCFLELTWSGAEPVTLDDGSERTFLEDGDTVTLRASAPGPHGSVLGFGECVGTVLPAR